MLTDLRFRLRALFKRKAMDRELATELQLHYEREVEKRVARGLTPADAGRQARLAMGGIDQVTDETRDAWGLRFLDAIRRDAVYAVRELRHMPGLTAVIVLTLALGIGAATAMFSVVKAVLLEPLPWLESERLAAIHMVYPDRRADPRYASTWDRSPAHYPAWDALRTGASFDDVAVWRPPTLGMTIDSARTEIVPVMTVSSNFLPLLGARLVLGQHFAATADEEETYQLIISHEAWQRYFGGRPEIVGQPSDIVYASATYTPPWVIVGVLEPGFSFGGHAPALLHPIGSSARVNRQYFQGDFSVVARLAPGVTPEAAAAEATALVQASQPGAALSARAVSLLEEQVGTSARALWILFGAAGVLLLLACANVAGLLVGEGRRRGPETATRLALGATRAGLVRQVVIEQLILAFVASVAGVVVAAWLTGVLVALAPEALPRLDAVAIDWRVALFAFGAGVLTLLVFGILPAATLVRTNIADRLRDGGRETAPAHHVAQRTVAAAEIALATVLVVGAGLLGETLFRLLSQPLGFNPANLLVVDTRFTGPPLPPDLLGQGRGGASPISPAERRELVETVPQQRTAAVVERLAALPGVVDAAAIGRPPVAGPPPSIVVRLDGRPIDEHDQARKYWVSAGFAGALGVPVLGGRALTPSDYRRGALVSREFERRYFPDGAVGRRFEWAYSSQTEFERGYEIVGVVPDLKHSTLADAPEPAVFAIGAASTFLIRTESTPEDLVSPVRTAIAGVNPQILVTGTRTMDAALGRAIAAERFRASLSTAFAATALLLAAVGVYGVAARRAADRRREFGIRIALGAGPTNLRALVIRDGLLIAGLGLAAGLPVALAASQLTRSLLFGVSPAAPHVFLGASVALTMAALLATCLPAHRASRVDPNVALRE